MLKRQINEPHQILPALRAQGARLQLDLCLFEILQGDILELVLNPFDLRGDRAQRIADVMQDTGGHFRGTGDIGFFHEFDLGILQPLTHMFKFFCQLTDFIFP